MKEYLFISLIIFAIIILLYFYFKSQQSERKDKQINCKKRCAGKRSQYRKKIKKSCGEFDAAAKNALKDISTIIDRNQTDNYTAGAIIEQNKNLGLPRGNDLNYVVERYQDAVLNINRPVTIPLIPPENPDDILNDLFILQHIENFTMDILQAEPPQMAIVNLHTSAVKTEETKKIQKLNEIKSIPGITKENITNTFIDSIITHTNDPQNTHDTSVNLSNRQTIEKIISEMSRPLSRELINENIKEIYEYPYTTPNKIAVLNRFTGDYVVSIGRTDTEILAATWERSKHPNNRDSSDKIKIAIIDSLENSYQNSGIVCINGRVSNVISGLVTLDFNPEIGSALTEEQHKNDILNSCKDLLKSALTKCKESPDPKTQQINIYYEDINAAAPEPEVLANFNKELGKDIDILVDSYKGKITEFTLDKIRKDCKLASEINE